MACANDIQLTNLSIDELNILKSRILNEIQKKETGQIAEEVKAPAEEATYKPRSVDDITLTVTGSIRIWKLGNVELHRKYLTNKSFDYTDFMYTFWAASTGYLYPIPLPVANLLSTSCNQDLNVIEMYGGSDRERMTHKLKAGFTYEDLFKIIGSHYGGNHITVGTRIIPGHPSGVELVARYINGVFKWHYTQ